MTENGKISKRFEKGQALILVVASAVGLIALLALTLDGGFALMRRRAAQNAADAGALGGARELCESGSAASAVAVAIKYAIIYNSAQSATETSIDGIVTVDAVAQYNSFFAGIFGIGQIEVAARAKAGCFAPGLGEGVLPTAWSCNPPVDVGLPTPDASFTFGDCEVLAIDPRTLEIRQGTDENSLYNFHHTWYPELYIIMDSGKTGSDDIVCVYPPERTPEEGEIQCDLDGDGINDLLADGDRSWLDLDGGGGGSNELVDWIEGDAELEIVIHTWIPGQQGVTTSVFKAAAKRVGDIALVPVFNAICETDPFILTNCLSIAHGGSYTPGTDFIAYAGGTFTSYFHIIGFAAFYISCVQTVQVDPEKSPEGCPGYRLAREAGIIEGSEKTLEGYFINKGFLQGISGQPSDGVDAGVYTVYLIE